MLLAALVLATSTWVRAQEPAPPQIAAEPVTIPCEFGNASARKYEVVDVVETFRGSESLGKYTMVRTFTERVAKRRPQGLLVHWSFGAPRFPDGRPKDDLEAELALVLGKVSKVEVDASCEGKPASIVQKPFFGSVEKLISVPADEYRLSNDERRRFERNKVIPVDPDDVEDVNKQLYVLTRVLQLFHDAEDFAAVLYPFAERRLSFGVPVCSRVERPFLEPKKPIAHKTCLTMTEIRESERIWIFERTRTVDRPDADAVLVDMQSKTRQRIERRSKGAEALPIDSLGDLVKALEETTRYEIEMDSGWPRLVEHTFSRVDEDFLRHQSTRTIRRIAAAAPK